MITFTKSEFISRYPLPVKVVVDWLFVCAKRYGFDVGDLNYRITNDDEILLTNQQFLKHDYYTDIITFDYVEGQVLNGDIVISLDTVRSNAKKYRVDFKSEYLRVCVHGLLHLCGFNDKSEKEAAQMRLEENKCLEMFHVKH